MFEVLSNETCTYYAIKHYDFSVGICRRNNVNSDINIPQYLNKLFYRYKNNGDLRERLILNHITVFFNVFTDDVVPIRLLFFKVLPEYYYLLKTFLVYLDRCPEVVYGVPDNLNIRDIPVDDVVMKVLERL